MPTDKPSFEQKISQTLNQQHKHEHQALNSAATDNAPIPQSPAPNKSSSAQPSSAARAILRLAIPTPLRVQLFDYLALADTDTSTLKPGMRFQVSFGRRDLIGYFISLESNSALDIKKLKAVKQQIDLDHSPIDSHLFKLISWSAKYYHHNLGMCLHAALPKKIRSGADTIEHTKAWQLSHLGLGLAENSLKAAKRQQAFVEYLRQYKRISQPQLKQAGFNKSIINALKEKNLIEELVIEKAEQAFICSDMSKPLLAKESLRLNEEQQGALTAITASSSFSCHLINGVTGSGKTEVYLQAIEYVLRQDKQALVLIPEIALTPQTLARFAQRFNCPVVNMHSGLGEKQRLTHWQQAKAGAAAIVIGTRSAVFAPFRKLGIIIVDEEHDGSYKQQSGFRYSAKDVAVRRAQLLNIPIVLGSATPSCESLFNAEQKRYQQHFLLERANDASKPDIQLIDVRKQMLRDGFSAQLLSAIEQRLSNNEQVIVFINRRGFAPTLLCHSCGWLAGCKHCDSRLTVHRKVRQLRCHHCGYQQPLVHSCPQCNSHELRALGSGTQRSEGFLQEHFKDTAVIRIDSDSTQNKKSLEKMLIELNTEKPAILIGTQMLAKGHHFPNVTLVAILDSDTWLFSNDFRGDERMAQLMTQVSGRSGRGAKKGKTLIQTHLPEHPFWTQFFSGGYALLSKNILAQRQATLMPPYSHLCLIHAEHPHPEKAFELLKLARQWLAKNKTRDMSHTECIGPYPSTLARKAGHYRFLLQLKHIQRKSLHQTIAALSHYLDQQKLAKKVNWSVNIDPQETS